jgi:hypothetical protein
MFQAHILDDLVDDLKNVFCYMYHFELFNFFNVKFA